MKTLRVQICAGLLLAADRQRRARTGAVRPASITRRCRPRHAGQLQPRRDRHDLCRRRQQAGHRQVLALPRADAARLSHRAPQPRHAVFAVGVRPRCGTGDDHAARCGPALHVDAGDRRGPLHARGRLRSRHLHLHAGEDRHALRLARSPHPGRSGQSGRHQAGSRLAGCHRGRRSRAVRGASRCPTGIRRARRRCATRCWRWPRPFPTRSARSEPEARSILSDT